MRASGAQAALVPLRSTASIVPAASDCTLSVQVRKTGGPMDEAVAAAKKFLSSNGVKVDEASVQSLTADIFDETGLAGGRESFARAFAELARQS